LKDQFPVHGDSYVVSNGVVTFLVIRSP
jgi:hypothetical protein